MLNINIKIFNNNLKYDKDNIIDKLNFEYNNMENIDNIFEIFSALIFHNEY